MGCGDKGPWLQILGVSLGGGLAFEVGVGGRIKLPQRELGNCFGAKSKVRELRVRWPVALTAQRSAGGERGGGGGGKGQEGETK